jgi:hypothetical protein
MSGLVEKRRHVLGLDLGQAADYTALVSLKVSPNPYGLQTTRATRRRTHPLPMHRTGSGHRR